LRDDQVHAGLNLPERMLLGADERGHRHAMRLRHGIHLGRRNAECVRDQADWVAECDLHEVSGPDALGSTHDRVVQVEGHAVLCQEIVGERLMLVGNARQHVLGRHVGVRGKIFGEQEVDAVRLSIDMGVDPGEFLFEGFRRVAGPSKDAKSAGPRDGHDHIPAMAKGEWRELAAQHLSDCKRHPQSSLERRAPGPLRSGATAPEFAAPLSLEISFLYARRVVGQALGLVNSVVPQEKVLEAALELSQRVRGNAPLSVQASKRSALGSETAASTCR